MRIVQALGWYHPESVGGTEVYVAGLAARLRAAGHDVAVAAPAPGVAAEREYAHEGVPVYRYPTPDAPSRAEAQGTTVARGAERFHAWLRRERPDVVHVHTFTTGLGLAEVWAARAAGARVVATTHLSSLGYVCVRGTMMRDGRAPCDGLAEPVKCTTCALQQRGVPRALAAALGATPPGLARRAAAVPGRAGTMLGMRDVVARSARMQRAMLAELDRFVVLTEWARQTVVRNGAPPDRVVLNRLGLGQSVPARKSGPDTHPTSRPVRVGYLGRYEELKGVLVLARAVARLAADVPIAVEFRGPTRTAEARAVVARVRAIVGDDPRVRFAPEVPSAEVPGVLAQHDVLCCPSLCFEGGPTVAIEAHAVGTPVIGSRLGGLAELITDGLTGRLLAPGDDTALAAALHEIATSPATSVDHWRRALPPARTMDQVAADHERLYAAVLAEAAVNSAGLADARLRHEPSALADA